MDDYWGYCVDEFGFGSRHESNFRLGNEHGYFGNEHGYFGNEPGYVYGIRYGDGSGFGNGDGEGIGWEEYDLETFRWR
jgi:hypothetical protein